jgi:hypothetical protein
MLDIRLNNIERENRLNLLSYMLESNNQFIQIRHNSLGGLYFLTFLNNNNVYVSFQTYIFDCDLIKFICGYVKQGLKEIPINDLKEYFKINTINEYGGF